MRRFFCLVLALLLLFLSAAASNAELNRGRLEIVREMISCHGTGEDAALEGLLTELEKISAEDAQKWRRIMTLWQGLEDHLTIPAGVLPDGLPDTEEMGIVVLGYQLNSDGTMREELLGRLSVALESAKKYPRSYLVLTGGHTAYQAGDKSEAGEMAGWLISQGISPDRIIVEDASLTTGQNTLYSVKILREQYPQVRYLAVVTSDYHVPVGVLLFAAESVLLSDEEGHAPFHVIACAAYPTPHGALSSSFGTSALSEVARGWDESEK